LIVAESRFQYTGDLAEEPLPEILRTIHHYRVPGVVTATSGDVVKKIYLRGGNVIFATSSDLADSLGAYLKQSSLISSGELRVSTDRIHASQGKRHGALLVEMGVLTPEQLRQIVTEQVKAILYSMFSWEKGTVTFEAGTFRTEEHIQLDVPTAQAIADGIRRLPDPRRVVSRLGPSWTVFDRGEVTTEASGVSWSASELKLLSRVDGRHTLRDLITAGLDDVSTNAKLVYAFWVLHLVTRRDVQTSGIRRIQWKTGSGGLSGGGGAAAGG
jgi:two-component system OmpR family response regulator